MSPNTDRPGVPAEAMAELLDGNRRFVAGTPIHPHQDAQRREGLISAQHPFAVVFGCSDSRLAAEIVFDRGLGDLFVVRTAGHIIGPEVLASIEYGVTALGAPLVVVLGHDSCGAIHAATIAMEHDRPAPQNLRPIIDNVMPSLRYARSRHIHDQEGVLRTHIQRTVDMIIQMGAATADAVAAGTCAVVGMSYSLADGRVTVTSAADNGIWGTRYLDKLQHHWAA